MKTNFKKIIYPIIAVFAWLFIWELIAQIVGEKLILPGIIPTISAFLNILQKSNFYLSVIFTLLRITVGFLCGSLIAFLLATVSYKIEVVKVIISPFMTLVKAVPVASFIMIVWIMAGSDSVPTIISALMVLPIVYHNTLSGLNSIDKELYELCKIFKLTAKERFEFLYFPSLLKYVIPAFVSTSSLAWKAGVAAEIIAYTANSIGKEIYFAKADFEIAEMFAWTFVVIIISLLIEFGIKKAFGRFLKND